MNSLMRYLSVGARIVCGTAAYLLVMAAVVIPTALELAGNFGMSVSVRDAWLGISAITITVALGLDRLLSRRLWLCRVRGHFGLVHRRIGDRRRAHLVLRGHGCPKCLRRC